MKKKFNPYIFASLGVALGAGIGAAMGNVAIGAGIGAALGSGMMAFGRRK